MSRLTKFIESLQRNVVVIKSKSTNSEYFEIGLTKIRVSDHFSDKVLDIQVVLPFNSKTTYLCKIKEGVTILTFTLKELKQFISNYVLVNNITKHSLDFEKTKKKIAKEQSEIDKLKYQNKSEIINTSNNLSKILGFNVDDKNIRLDVKNYSKCAMAIKQKTGLHIGSLSTKKRKLFRSRVVGSDLSWDELIIFIKEAVSAKVFKGSVNNLEAYINNKF